MRDLARRLLALEAEHSGPADGRAHEAVRVCEKLRGSLTRFAGADGFAALLRRTLALARAEEPALNRVSIKPDCSMEGLEALAAEASDRGLGAAAALMAHLLGLMVMFIGEPLTLCLVRDAWPNVSLED